jgi:hypothetical protein
MELLSLPPQSLRRLSNSDGHEKSLGGTQASGAGESHPQDANVAEVSYGKPVIGEPEHPSSNHLTARRRAIWERSIRHGPSNAPDKQVTNGAVEVNQRIRCLPLTQNSKPVVEVFGSLNDHFIREDDFPA